MITKTQTLTDRYALLKLEIQKLDAELKTIAAELKSTMRVGEAVATHEYRLSYNPGRSQFTWTCSKEEKHKLQEHLVASKVADYTITEPYVSIRFLKGSGVDV